MNRRWWERALAAVMAVWLIAVVAEPAFLHSCPMHGGLSLATSASAANHAVHQHASPAEQKSPEKAPASHQCTCLGDCGIGTSVAVPAAIVAHVAVVTTIAYQLALPASEFTPAPPATLLPFANGPPTQV